MTSAPPEDPTKPPPVEAEGERARVSWLPLEKQHAWLREEYVALQARYAALEEQYEKLLDEPDQPASAAVLVDRLLHAADALDRGNQRVLALQLREWVAEAREAASVAVTQDSPDADRIPALMIRTLQDARRVLRQAVVNDDDFFHRMVRAIDYTLDEVGREHTPAAGPSAEAPRELERTPCEGLSASWCPNCGDCTCSLAVREAGEWHDDCPLHGRDSKHGMVDVVCELCGGSGRVAGAYEEHDDD